MQQISEQISMYSLSLQCAFHLKAFRMTSLTNYRMWTKYEVEGARRFKFVLDKCIKILISIKFAVKKAVTCMSDDGESG